MHFMTTITKDHLDHFIAVLFHGGAFSRMIQAIGIIILLIFAALLVYVTGGTKYAYVHAIYLPVLLAALAFGVPGGALSGAIGGILVGPFMPLDATTGATQETVSWVARMAAFVAIGSFAGGGRFILRRYSNMMHEHAYTDSVSGLPNRAQLLADLGRDEPSFRDDQYLTVMQLVRYREVISTLGYHYADELSLAAALRLNEVGLKQGRLYDLRDGMFALLLHSKNEIGVQTNMSSLQQSLQQPFIINDIPVHIEGRFGSVKICRKNIPRATIRFALAALENAREDDVEHAFYAPARDLQRQSSAGLLVKFKRALEGEGALQLFYQPKISLSSQDCVGVEALIRWHDKDDGWISPALFVPQVDKTALMTDLTRWVLQEAIQQAGHWAEQGLFVPIAVNVSMRDLEHDDFLKKLSEMLVTQGLPSHLLEIEITESAVMQSGGRAVDRVSELQEAGISVALDDFGTGYSSLSHLRQLPVDTVKLDRSLVQGVTHDRKLQSLVGAVAHLSRGFEFEIVAEGIEDAATGACLEALGCRFGQGFHYARPMPASEVSAVARRIPKSAGQSGF